MPSNTSAAVGPLGGRIGSQRRNCRRRVGHWLVYCEVHLLCGTSRPEFIIEPRGCSPHEEVGCHVRLKRLDKYAVFAPLHLECRAANSNGADWFRHFENREMVQCCSHLKNLAAIRLLHFHLLRPGGECDRCRQQTTCKEFVHVFFLSCLAIGPRGPECSGPLGGYCAAFANVG